MTTMLKNKQLNQTKPVDVVEINFAARNIRTGRVIEGTTLAARPEYWLSG